MVEQLPNVNDARRFANKFRGRVFLAGYADLRDDMMQWGDALTNSDRRTAGEDRSRYTVFLNQYKAMQTALFRVRDKLCLFPYPGLLEQEVIEDGKTRRIPIVREWLFTHLTKTALVVEDTSLSARPDKPRDARRWRSRVIKIGIDPHFAYALMLADVAWARNYGTGSFMMPEVKDALVTDLAQRVEQSMPGLPKHIVAMIDQTPPGTCGRCSAFD